MILFIDCYDSFSYNLTHLIESACPEPVVVCHNDQITKDQLRSYLPLLHAIVLGPGPGNPHDSVDSGVVTDVWELVAETPVPVFGICFGYQSQVLAFGGQVEKMSPPVHGQVAAVHHKESRLFQGIPSPFNAVRYHSLHATLVGNALMSTATTDGVEMAAEHRSLPIYGVQFHPESVLSEYGLQLFKNFWALAMEFNASRQIQPGSIPRNLTVEYTSLLKQEPRRTSADIKTSVMPKLDWPAVAECLDDFVLLKSASFPGEWSIFGILEPRKTLHLRSKDGQAYSGLLYGDSQPVSGDIWQIAADLMAEKMLDSDYAKALNPHRLPFLGGLIGYITYEGGCRAGLDIEMDSGMNSDMSFVYVEKSIHVSKDTGQVYAAGPENWVEEMARVFQSAQQQGPTTSLTQVMPPKIKKPSRDNYDAMFAQCSEKLCAGDSYELCLTTQTELDFSEADPWSIFMRLVARNPAPYSSFMSFDDGLIATSPERFLSWTPEQCEFRPIKGTVRKTSDMTLDRATEILRTPKEQGENLMIVDLIRHDLGHLLNDVRTNQLMAVEEYHSVYQLVTSVEGRFDGRNSGIDILSQSLPPGSMTGAPKKRSVEILAQLEQQPRGLYSGVHGYWSIDDRGDWSVVIRSLFQRRGAPTWRIGAGGAVTVLSTADGEFEEMNTKFDAVLKAFI